MEKEIVEIENKNLDVVEAEFMNIRQSTIRAVEGGHVELQQVGALSIDGERVEVTQGASVLMRGETLSLNQSIAVVTAANTAELEFSFTPVAFAVEDMTVDRSAAGIMISKEINAANCSSIFMAAKTINGDVTTLLDWKSALALGAVAGGIFGLFSLFTKRK
ncbi:MAG: hypothetical protein L0Y62_01050 [Nitrospirae bacterium]|nr:hypothetical protein [Nitrospirota bacterium]